MTKVTSVLAAALIAVPGLASAQSAAEIYSYKAPSGMFGEGTAKWQMFRYLTEDQEYRDRLRAEREADGGITTGSVRPPVSSQGTAVNGEQVARPGERGARRNPSR